MSLKKRIASHKITIQEINNFLVKESPFKKIIETHAFERLKDISFLGAIDYRDHHKKYSLQKIERTRYQHSLYVASLAFYISSLRNYNEYKTKNIVAAALLHDIGHFPLSHSTEHIMKKKIGFGHHELGERIFHGKINKFIGLFKILKQEKYDFLYIKHLLDTKSLDKSDGSDLFSNKINIDTIDAIIRCMEYKTTKRETLNRLQVALASFCEQDKNYLSILDDFWQQKDFVYKNIINSNYGIFPDKISEFFFLTEDVNEDTVTSTENFWKRKFKQLFTNIKNMYVDNEFKNNEFHIINRDYTIQTNEKDLANRYIYTKKQTSLKIELSSPKNKPEQLKFSIGQK